LLPCSWKAKLLTADAPQFQGCDAIARQKTVEGLRRRVPRCAFIEDERTPTCSAEDKRRAETGGTATHDEDIIHRAILHRTLLFALP